MSEVANLLKKYYNKNIQITQNILKLVLRDCVNAKGNNPNAKLLVFGLGYDSELWHNSTIGNTFFVENNIEYINLNKNIIPEANIIFYDFEGITVSKSKNIINNNSLLSTDSFMIPQKLLDSAPYDIILIDGPAGYDNDKIGRLLPIYWSQKYLSKSGTIIYIDDCKRPLESACINKYFCDNKKNIYNERLGCAKIYC